ncbi:MAG TPA: hypothetical protein VJ984_02550 [Xanthomonadales bacterium]|nr:hypothetical protein [Xanthomonadales bacterium]
MKSIEVSRFYAATIAIVAGFAINDVMADPPEHSNELSGRIYAVHAEVVGSLDPGFPVGTEFDNCYSFNEDGTWFDPLYPDFGIAVPGVWIQHDDRPQLDYTATVANQSETPGLLLIQNGTATPGPANGSSKLVAYTTVFLIDEGNLPVVEVKSVGEAVDSCPYF